MEIKRSCLICDKIFFVKSSRIKNGGGKFCSYRCYGIWQSKNGIGKNNHSWKGGKIKRTCQICQKEFEVTPAIIKREEGKFCSNKCHSIWKSENIRGRKAYGWKGGKKEKICIICNKKYYITSSRFNISKFCSRKCRGVWQKENKKNKNNPNWRGGKSNEYQTHRAERQWDNIRKQVYKRDNYICQICEKSNIKIHAHHIIPYRISLDDSLENLITLCDSCHMKEERKYHKNLKGQLEFNWL